jgi:hypothetical protein
VLWPSFCALEKFRYCLPKLSVITVKWSNFILRIKKQEIRLILHEHDDDDDDDDDHDDDDKQ